jgi:hypothetical protein
MLSGSESKQRAKSWPYPRHRRVDRELRRIAAAWFAAKGYPVQDKRPYILDKLENWSKNIILPQVAEYIENERRTRQGAGEGFPIHKYLHHGLSSQAMVFNLIGPLIVRNDYEPLRALLASKNLPWPSGNVTGQFETEDRSVFNENYGQPTSFDVAITGEAGPGVYIESKFIEPGFGGCSVYSDGDCDGRNPLHNPSLCYLDHIGRLYWQRVREHRLDELAHGPICPMTLYYQFFREMLFALHMDGCFILLHDERNPSFSVDGPSGRRGAFALLTEQLPEHCRCRVGSVSIQEVAASIRNCGGHEDWIGEFEAKYGLNGSKIF